MCKACIALTILLILCPNLTFASPSALPITMTASLEQPVCPEGQPAILALALHNEGTQRLLIGYSAFEESSFSITIKDMADRIVPRTAFGERIVTPPGAVFANVSIELSPGQTRRYRFNLTRMFDLSRQGDYTVSVSHVLYQDFLPSSEGTRLAAGPLTLHMVENADSDSGPMAVTQLPARRPFLYVADRDSGSVTCFRINNDGRPLPTLIVPPLAGKYSVSIAATLDGRFLYVGNRTDNAIHQFQIGGDGALHPLFPLTVQAQKFPGFLLIDPKGRFLYALSNWGNTLFSIGLDGRLKTIGQNSSEEWFKDQEHNIHPSDFGAIDPTGKFLYACNGRTIGCRIDSEGRVTTLTPPAPLVAGPNESNDRAIAFSPSGHFAFILTTKPYSEASNGSPPDDLVVPMRVEANGGLTPLPGVQIPRGPEGTAFGNNIMSVEPSGHFLLVLNKISGLIARYQIGADGSLRLLGVTPEGGEPFALTFRADDHTVYTLNQYYSSITTFRLDNQGNLIKVGLDTAIPGLYDGSFAMAAVPTSQEGFLTRSGLEVSVRLDRDVFTTDMPVVLTMAFKNLTTHPVSLGKIGADMSAFRLSLTGPPRQSPGYFGYLGEPATAAIPLLAAGEDLSEMSGRSRGMLVLPSGAQRQYRFVLSRLADLSNAGNYTVQVSRLLPGKTAAVSSVLHFRLDNIYNGIGGYDPDSQPPSQVQELDVL